MKRKWIWLWTLVVAGLAHALGHAAGSLIAELLSLPPQRLPVSIEGLHQSILALSGGLVIAIGLSSIASGLSGRFRERWTILAAFAFVVNGVSIALETRVFTSIGGEFAFATSTLVASLLCAFAVAGLAPTHDKTEFATRLAAYLARWRIAPLAARLTAAWIAFPLFYLMFGAAISPIVNPWYSSLEFLHIPPLDVIVGTQLIRSFLFLLVSLPVVVGWSGSRARLAFALGVGHFTAVGFSGLIQAPFFPFEMAIAHTAEILADSLAYGWALAFLLFPSRTSKLKGSAPSDSIIRIARGLRVVAAILCLLAIGNWPYVYYFTVRWFVLLACIISAFIAFRLTRKGSLATYVAIAIVLNPVFTMPFSQQVWMLVDAIAGVVLLGSVLVPSERSSPADNAGSSAECVKTPDHVRRNESLQNRKRPR